MTEGAISEDQAKGARSNGVEIVLGFSHGFLITFGTAIFGQFLSAQVEHWSYPSRPVTTAIAIAIFLASMILPFVFEIRSASRSYNQNKDSFAKGQIIAISVYFFVFAYLFFFISRNVHSDM